MIYVIFLGIIIFYELWIRGIEEDDGTRDPPEYRIFHPAGSYSPRPTQSPQETPFPPPATNYTVTGLDPYTEYEFQVISQNELGKAASPWAVGRTLASCELYYL